MDCLGATFAVRLLDFEGESDLLVINDVECLSGDGSAGSEQDVLCLVLGDLFEGELVGGLA